MAGLRRAALGGLTAAALAACGGTAGTGGLDQAANYAGDCTVGGGDLTFAPLRGAAGPAFRLTAGRGEGDYDVQVNAVDAGGRYGPDARGTVHLDGSQRTGTLTTPDLHLPTGETVRFAGRWHCVSTGTVAPPSERPGGPASPR